MKHTYAFLLALVLLFCQSLVAQEEADEVIPLVKSFIAETPDIIVQGEPFTMTYTLTARSWKSGGHVLKGKGFELKKVTHNTEQIAPYSRLTATATYLTSLHGQLELPGMMMIVGNDTIYSKKKTINVLPNSRYGEEMSTAHRWLLAHGQHPDSLCLSLSVADDGFYLFTDRRNHCFCIVAQKEVWPLVGEPILAYSTEDYISLNDNTDSYNFMVNPYRQQIYALRQSVGQHIRPTALPYQRQHNEVAPLLGLLKWGQAEPYNAGTPVYDGKKTLVGCVPLAVGMLLRHYAHPAQGRSHVFYKDNTDKIYELDFGTFTPDWQQFQNEYKEDDCSASVQNLSEVLTFLGYAIDAQFSHDGTATSLDNIKHTLCNNLGYSGRMSLYEDNLSEAQIMALLYQELDNGRPSIVSNTAHAFVCDGYKDDYFHFNLGWYGNYNGYYRLKLGNYALSDDDGQSLLPVRRLVCGIEPQRASLKRKVTLSEPGTLAKLLSPEEQQQVTTLVVSGPLNSADVKLLRKMAGASDDPPLSSWQGGSLRELDLQNATITSDSAPYLSAIATSSWSYTEKKENGSQEHHFDFNNMSEQEWQSFCNLIGAQQAALFYTRSSDHRYWANYICQSNMIGQHMFADCTSLHSIVLPKDTKKIDDYAFWNCSSLQSIILPPGTLELGHEPFAYCAALEEVHAPRNIKLTNTLGKGCSPVLQGITPY